MRLTGSNVLVKLDSDESVTDSGLVLQYDKKMKNDAPMTGTVIATGEGHRTKKGIIPLDVEPGDKIFMHKWAGWEVEVDDEKYLIIPENHILAIVR